MGSSHHCSHHHIGRPTGGNVVERGSVCVGDEVQGHSLPGSLDS